MDAQKYDEQLVLAILLAYPQANEWELSGLSPDLFRNPVHRLIATALCRARDSGRRVHWRRVRALLRKRGHACAADVETLVRAIGTSWGLTAAVSRLHRARAENTRRAA
jgi:replicative DNA helicase